MEGETMHRTAASHHMPCQSCAVRDQSIFAVLSDQELREVSKIITSVSLAKGATVFFEGDENTYLFNVVSGAVRLSKLLRDGRRQITGFSFPGDLFGLSVADEYAYTAETLSETSLCRFNRASLIKLLNRFPRLEHRLLELAANELIEAQAHMLLLGQKHLMEKVSTTLFYLMRRIGERRGDATVIELPMGRTDLAEYAGVAMESVSRSLTQLSKLNVIRLPTASSVHIIREDELERLSGY
jgi:CRP/FNR family transcriptional regulator